MYNVHMNEEIKYVEEAPGSAKLLVEGAAPVTVIGTKEIRNGMDATCYQQVCNVATAPGIDNVVVSPDFHAGYGCVVGSTFSSQTHVFPCAVGPDIACSMSLLALDLPKGELLGKEIRRTIMNAIEARIPTGTTNRLASKARRIESSTLRKIATEGASLEVLSLLGIPASWKGRCEDSSHGDPTELNVRFEELAQRAKDKLPQIGSTGSGNHFSSCDEVVVDPANAGLADAFGLKDGTISVLTHCGSRGFGFQLAAAEFAILQKFFNEWGIPLPGNSKEMVYAPLGTIEASNYLADMSLGANFAIVNHLLINFYILESFREVLGESLKGQLVYYLSHNIIRKEIVNNRPTYVHRKGATRAYPGGHFSLQGTCFASTGHPILLPGNAKDGSVVMVANKGAELSLNSVNHGAGRCMGRKQASRILNQFDVNAEMNASDILYNGRNYPIDEAAGAYKNFAEVTRSVELAGLASRVATLKPRFVIKDNEQDRETKGAA